MRTATVAALGLALAATLASAGAAADDVTLKYTLKEGDVFFAKNIADQDMQMDLMGNKIPVKMKVTMVQKYKVLSAKPGAAEVEMTITDMTMDAGGLPGVGNVGEQIKGVSLTATLDDKFEVTKVAGADKLLDKLAAGDPNMKAMMKGMLGDAAVKQWFAGVFPPVPDKAVAPGGSWTRTDKMPFPGLGSMTVKKKLTLDKVSGGVATIKETAEVEFKADADGAAGLPFKFTKSDLKTKDYTSTHEFDVAAGRLKSSKTAMTMSGSLTVSANGQEIEIGMDMKTVSTVTVTDKNPVKD